MLHLMPPYNHRYHVAGPGKAGGLTHPAVDTPAVLKALAEAVGLPPGSVTLDAHRMS